MKKKPFEDPHSRDTLRFVREVALLAFRTWSASKGRHNRPVPIESVSLALYGNQLIAWPQSAGGENFDIYDAFDGRTIDNEELPYEYVDSLKWCNVTLGGAYATPLERVEQIQI